jgi:Fe-S cluster assembly protein SufD
MVEAIAKETIYEAAFRERISHEENPRLAELRRAAFARFKEIGFPTQKNEEWKYTNLAQLVGSEFKVQDSKSESNTETNLIERFDFRRNGFTALNFAFADFVCIRIPKETKIEEPIELKFSTKENAAGFPHVVIVAGRGCIATIIESYESTGKCFTNSALQIFVEDDANITHYRVQKESSEAFHVGTTEVGLNRGSVYNSTNITLGGRISRHDVHLKFGDEGAECFVDGLYLIGDEQHADTHSSIDHTVPNCTSHQNYKGIVDGKARAVFNGKVFVRENARGTDARQSNKNLLLSNDARVDTKPQLEIFNDDVKCAHGATVGQLGEEEVFYLLSRGIEPNLARNLLTYGFAEEIVNKIGIESIKKDLDDAVLNRLHANLEM